jgi:hypothetical protein
VQHITVGDRCFWAGEKRGAYILHHNSKDAGGGYNPLTSGNGNRSGTAGGGNTHSTAGHAAPAAGHNVLANNQSAGHDLQFPAAPALHQHPTTPPTELPAPTVHDAAVIVGVAPPIDHITLL